MPSFVGACAWEVKWVNGRDVLNGERVCAEDGDVNLEVEVQAWNDSKLLLGSEWVGCMRNDGFLAERLSNGCVVCLHADSGRLRARRRMYCYAGDADRNCHRGATATSDD
jgi:hypothetical protein